MNYHYDPGENERVAEARESFSGRLLTNHQFDEALAITHVIERKIKESGSFKEKLGDYAYAFARTERFDAAKSEMILRDIFKERTGHSMNQMRETLMEAEKSVLETDEARQKAYQYAADIGGMIETGNKITFNRAYSHQGQHLAQDLGVTDAGAKRLMRDEFKAVEGTELYDWGKDMEERFYVPQIEAEKQAREANRSQSRSSSRSDERAGPTSHTQSRSRVTERATPRPRL